MSQFASTTDEDFSNTGPLWRRMWEDWNDVYALTSNEPVAASSPWIGTALSSGTFAQTTTGLYGVAVQSAAATTDNSGSQVQGDLASWNLPAGKAMEFIARVKQSDATQSEVLLGMCVTDTTLLDGTGTLAAGLTFTDGVFFYTPDGEANWYLVVRVGSINVYTSGAIAAESNDAFQVLKFRVDVDPTIASKMAVQGSVYDEATSVLYQAGSTFLTNGPASSVVLTPSWSFNSGDASGTKTCTNDYIGVRLQR